MSGDGDPANPCGSAFRSMHTPHYRNGRQLAAGESLFGHRSQGVFEGRLPSPKTDPRLDKPKRPCARCGRRFQPTVKRRMLCAGCFSTATESPMAPEHLA